MAVDADVCIIGGGPSGSAFAVRMAGLGYRVVVVERDRFPRPHVGEALTPGVWPLLETLGLREPVEEVGFVPVAESLVRWGDSTTRTVTTGSREPGLNIDRGRFDEVLLERARTAGAVILQPAYAARPCRAGSGWEVPVRRAGKELVVRAAFVADAGGRGSALGGRRQRTSARTIALCGTWECRGVRGARTRVQAGPKGWFWGAHGPDGAFRAMAFVDRSLMRDRKVSRVGLESLYLELIGGTDLLEDLAEPRLAGPVLATDATCYEDRDPVGWSFIKLGEASFTIDPLSSAGVQKALQTALAGSVVAHTLISGQGDGPAALEFYRDDQRHSVKQHAEWAAGCYCENKVHREEAFWAMRAGPAMPPRSPGDDPLVSRRDPDPRQHRPARDSVEELLPCQVGLADEAALIESPCIVGGHVERRPALHHPSLTRPVAYLGGVELSRLLRCLQPERTHSGPAVAGPTLREVLVQWAQEMPMEFALRVAEWLNRMGALARVQPGSTEAQPP